MRPSPVPTIRARGFVTALAILAVTLLPGCGGGDNGGTTNPPPGGFAMSASGAALTIARNANASLTVTIARSGGFTGSVSLSTTGLPTGVTVAFAPPQVDDGVTSSTMTVTVGGAAATGPSTFTVRGTATGQSMQTVNVQLTVTAPPVQTGPFTLSVSAQSFLVYPSGQLPAFPVITINRNAGFTGAVALSVSGLPPTLFLGMTPTSTTGNTVNTVILSLAAPNGTYTATIRGSSAQGDQTVTIQVVVAPVSTGNIKWKWCSASLPRYFLAVKDGNGPWTRIMPANDTSFNFSIASGAGQVAEVTNDSGGFRTTVYQYTAQEMAARAASQCALVNNASTRMATGNFGGVTGFRVSYVGMGWWFGSANGNGSYQLLNLPAGPLDLIAARAGEVVDASAIPIDRMILRRGINPTPGGTIPALDFNAAESFAPATATWTFGNTNGETFGVSQLFTTATGSTGHFSLVPMVDGTLPARTLYGVPLAQTIAGDLHQVIATVSTTGPTVGSVLRASRQVIAYSRTLANRNLDFGPAMPAPTVSIAAPGRLRAQGTLPTQYNTGVTFDITQTTTATFATIHTSRGFLGAGSTYDIQFPDLTAAIGWDTRFGVTPGVPTNWWVNGGGPVLDLFDGRYLFNTTRSRWTGIGTGITLPADAATYYSARVTGNSTP